jgi:hypothetical protein
VIATNIMKICLHPILCEAKNFSATADTSLWI